MAAPYTIGANGNTYTAIDDTTIAYDACLVGTLADESGGQLLALPAAIRVDMPGLLVASPANGMFGLAGYVNLVFPKLATTGYHLNLTIEASGYRTKTVAVAIPAGAALPFLILPVAMRALPVVLQGRVVADATRAAIAGAAVSVTTANVAMLRTPAYFDHAAAVAVNAITVTAAGAATTLAAMAAGGSNTITLASAAGIAVGAVLQLGQDSNADLATVSAVNAATGAVTLGNALNSTFPAGAEAQAVTILAAGGASTLARDTNAGDGLLFLTSTIAAAAIEIVDGATSEYHLTSALTDANGFYRCNGVGGIDTIALVAAAAGFGNLNQTHAMAYSDPWNVVDFRLLP